MKKASAIVRESIESRWGSAGVSAVQRLAEHIEEIEQARALEAGDDDWEGLLVAEARAIAAGTSVALPSVEHLQVLLRELDGTQRELDRVRCALSVAAIEGTPF